MTKVIISDEARDYIREHAETITVFMRMCSG